MAQSAESQAESFYLTSSLHFLSHLNPPKRCQAWHSGQGQPLCPLSAVQRAWSKLKKSMSDLPAGDHLPHVMPREQAGKGRGHRAPGVPGLQNCSHHVPAGALGVDESSPCQGSPVISLASGHLRRTTARAPEPAGVQLPETQDAGFQRRGGTEASWKPQCLPSLPGSREPCGGAALFPTSFPTLPGHGAGQRKQGEGWWFERRRTPHTWHAQRADCPPKSKFHVFWVPQGCRRDLNLLLFHVGTTSPSQEAITPSMGTSQLHRFI